MKFTVPTIAATIILVTAGGGWACEMSQQSGLPITSRKPLLADEARLGAGFGVRRHPVLGHRSMHTGIDWVAPSGSPVVAAGPGRIAAAGTDGSYGQRVIIDHGSNWQTVYAQLASIDVRSGDCVVTGTVIGTVGASGLATGPHLHFEVRHNDQFVDPLTIALEK